MFSFVPKQINVCDLGNLQSHLKINAVTYVETGSFSNNNNKKKNATSKYSKTNS
jgi:hypothetical protein